MDPNMCLQNIRFFAEQLHNGQLSPKEHVWVAGQLAEMVHALDGWISDGGFLPTDWAKPV